MTAMRFELHEARDASQLPRLLIVGLWSWILKQSQPSGGLSAVATPIESLGPIVIVFMLFAALSCWLQSRPWRGHRELS